MTDEQLLRYSRQILLPNFGLSGQARLQKSRVLLVGLGGLGSPIAFYLTAAGIGQLILADDDLVDLSNLQRQILFNNQQIGNFKASSAYQTLHALNPEVELIPLPQRITTEILPDLLQQIDLVVDASDRFATRFVLNAACVVARIPLVSGAAIRLEGQISVFSGQPGDPCYQCLYPNLDYTLDESEETCVNNGILAPVVGIIGSMQALEVIKILAGIGSSLNGRVGLFDAMKMEWRWVRLSADPACPICSGRI